VREEKANSVAYKVMGMSVSRQAKVPAGRNQEICPPMRNRTERETAARRPPTVQVAQVRRATPLKSTHSLPVYAAANRTSYGSQTYKPKSSMPSRDCSNKTKRVGEGCLVKNIFIGNTRHKGGRTR